jgi:hypothetical protein
MSVTIIVRGRDEDYELEAHGSLKKDQHGAQIQKDGRVIWIPWTSIVYAYASECSCSECSAPPGRAVVIR